MNNDHRSLDEIQTDIVTAQDEHEQAAQVLDQKRQNLEKLRDEQTKARTASFDTSVVQKASRLGINPDNFDTEQRLKEAILKVETENQEGVS